MTCKTHFICRFTSHIEGDYQLCFDNTFSRFSPKLVFFEILADEDEDNETNWNAAKEELGSLIDMTVDEFQVCQHILNNVKNA